MLNDADFVDPKNVVKCRELLYRMMIRYLTPIVFTPQKYANLYDSIVSSSTMGTTKLQSS